MVILGIEIFACICGVSITRASVSSLTAQLSLFFSNSVQLRNSNSFPIVILTLSPWSVIEGSCIFPDVISCVKSVSNDPIASLIVILTLSPWSVIEGLNIFSDVISCVKSVSNAPIASLIVILTLSPWSVIEGSCIFPDVISCVSTVSHVSAGLSPARLGVHGRLIAHGSKMDDICVYNVDSEKTTYSSTGKQREKSELERNIIGSIHVLECTQWS